jgi:hypothetical protein
MMEEMEKLAVELAAARAEILMLKARLRQILQEEVRDAEVELEEAHYRLQEER